MNIKNRIAALSMMGLATLSACESSNSENSGVDETRKAISATVEKNINSVKDAEYIVDERFSDEDVKLFESYKIELQIAEEYPERFESTDIISFVKNEVSPDDLAEFPAKLKTSDIMSLVKRGLKGDVFKEYNSRFDVNTIIQLFVDGVEPRFANAYNAKFSKNEVKYLATKRILPQEINDIDSDIELELQIMVLTGETTLEEISKYSDRFKNKPGDIKLLIRNFVSPTVANSFQDWLSADVIIDLNNKGLSSRYVSKYNKRFQNLDIKYFVQYGVDPEVANSYKEDYDGVKIVELYIRGISFSQANKLDSRFLKSGFDNGGNVSVESEYYYGYEHAKPFSLLKLGEDMDLINEYGSRFDSYEVLLFVKNNISPESAKSFNEGFNGYDILLFVRNGVDAELANNMYSDLNSFEMVEYVKSGK